MVDDDPNSTFNDLVFVLSGIRSALTLLVAIQLHAHPVRDKDEREWIQGDLNDLTEYI